MEARGSNGREECVGEHEMAWKEPGLLGAARGRVVRGRLGWGGSEILLLTHEKTPGFLAS